MPLTSKGETIKAALTKEYGSEKKGEQVLYAGKNKGTFTGIDADEKKIIPANPNARQTEYEQRNPPPPKADDEPIKGYMDAVTRGDSDGIRTAREKIR